MNFLKAKPGRPPLREYKQSMARHEASPLHSPVKRNFRSLLNYQTDHQYKLKYHAGNQLQNQKKFNQNIVHSPETGNQTQKRKASP